jgi:hypothetical protein
MKYILLAAVASIAVGAAGTAHAQSTASATAPVHSGYATTGLGAASLNALLADWDRAGFTPPSKPSQYRVYGRNGYVTSGPGYNAMVLEIRTAVSEVRQGHDADAAVHIAAARGLLASIATLAPSHVSL